MKRNFFVLVALAALLSACASTGDNPYKTQAKPKKAARLNTRLGIAYMRLGDNDRALTKLKRALKEYPRLAEAHAALALLYSRQNRLDRARKQYRRALSLAPDNPNIQNQYATFLCQQKDYDKAQAYFKKAADNHHYNTPEVALSNAGICHLRQNHTEQANSDFRRALQFNPDYPSALRHLARMVYRQGHYLQAKALMQRYDKHAKPTARTLLLQERTARALGDEKAAEQYTKELMSKFPASNEIQELKPMQSNE